MFSFVAIAIAYADVDVGLHKNRSAQPTALHNQFEPGTFDCVSQIQRTIEAEESELVLARLKCRYKVTA